MNETVRLGAQGRYAEAKQTAEKAVKVAEETVGPDHPDLAIALHNLAESYKRDAFLSKEEAGRQNAAMKAELTYKRALAIREGTIGLRNSFTVDTIIGLAEVYRLQRRYGDAETLYKRAIEILNELGPSAPILVYLRQRATSGLNQIEKERK